MPNAAYALLESLDFMNNAVRTFGQFCVRGLKANSERGRDYAERSVGLATLLNERLGFAGAAELAQRAAATGRSISELLVQESSIGGDNSEAAKEDQP
jgi:fumarate hydratase class II/aspartate ammonia-lyase